MKAGNFNINDYLSKLYEESEGGKVPEKEGLIIPEENKKFFNWLKKDYQKSQVEVKVEMKLGDSKFKPEYDLQTKLDSVKDFKPGMYGDIKTSETSKKEEKSEKPEASEKENKIEITKEKEAEVKTKTEEKPPEEKKELNTEKKEDKKEENTKTKDEKSNIKSKASVNINLKTKKEDDKK